MREPYNNLDCIEPYLEPIDSLACIEPQLEEYNTFWHAIIDHYENYIEVESGIILAYE